MTKKIVLFTCPHCGNREKDVDRWKKGSVWELNRPVGEVRCRVCRQQIKMHIVGDTIRVFASWSQLEAALKQQR